MKTALLIFYSFISLTSFAQFGINTPWTWMGGDKTINQAGVYGTQGVPSTLNKPGGRNNSITWTDAAGNFWLFGGSNFNDLWKYTTATNEWTWIKGSSTANQLGIYGTQGVSNPANTPGSRGYGTGWIDANDNLWLFGGLGNGETANGYLNDLWKYNPNTNEWTWMKGYKTVDNIPVLGTQGVPAAANTPGGRFGVVGWTDASGDFWLFGGFGYSAISVNSDFNQLWKYDPITNEWIWVKGAALGSPNGVYGTQGVPNILNNPGGRSASFRWIDNMNNLWLFGGYGIAVSGSAEVELNDLWKYNIATNEWTWMKGDFLGNQPGVYGVQGVADILNKPGGRDGGASWKDVTGNIWLFGGFDLNGDLHGDLWMYNIVSNNWTWMKGSNIVNQNGIYGTQGVPQTTNRPGGRYGVMSWADNSFNFWLFGGRGYAETGGRGNMNDLWRISSTALLPLTLTQFKGSIINKNEHLLSWQTENEFNTKNFTIERSTQGINFVSIGNVNASGQSAVPKHYSFINKYTLPGSNFYRLKMLDIDGGFTYSKIIEINQYENQPGIIISPNPVKDILYFQLNGAKGSVQMQIIDMEGKKIRETNLQVNQTNSFSINIGNFRPGMYLLSITEGNKMLQEKFVVQ